jgi:hypothetical protein
MVKRGVFFGAKFLRKNTRYAIPKNRNLSKSGIELFLTQNDALFLVNFERDQTTF